MVGDGMKRVKYLLVTLAIFFINLSLVSANSIDRIDIDVKLDENGTGHITEKWNMTVDSKTEVYKALSNLGNSSISNFTATMDGESYTSLSSWDINGSLNDKAYKNGIYYEDGKTELCWGMTSYGSHVYTITYDVSNMIYNTSDAQVLYWRFIDNNEMDPTTKQYSVKVSGPSSYKENLPIWGYGDLGGYAYVKDGIIEMSNADEGSLSDSEYVVLLTKYPLGMFTTTNALEGYNDFSSFSTLADEGSMPYTDDSGDSNIGVFVTSMFMIFFGICCFLIICIKVGSQNRYLKKEIDKKNLHNFRDIPCNKDIYKASFLSNIYSLSNKKEDLLGAILLKWLLDKKVTIIKEEKKGLLGTKNSTSLKFNDNITITDENEKAIYDIMIEASKDGILEENELKKWSKNNYQRLLDFFTDAEENVKNIYINEKHINIVEQGTVIKQVSYELDDYLYNEATNLAGLKQYLVEFSRIKEKQPIEVNLWEYYLIYAQIFGIAKEVGKQFKDLYPELIEASRNNGYMFDYTDLIWLNMLSSESVRAASDALSAARSYSAGGGGFSAGGGGGGSFGGGGGGCR